MREPAVFLKVSRQPTPHRPVSERLQDYKEVSVVREEPQAQEQAARCMNCFLPFCHWGCPVGNHIPEWNDHLASGRWEQAFRSLQATNNLPEVTARVCPATCESACVLEIDGQPVTIRENEGTIIERAFQSGWVQPHPPKHRTGKSVAVVGSGPAGLSCADQLNQAGHRVVVFERDDKIGGLLRYGIPDFKLEKWVIDRRLAIWQAEGIEFSTGVDVGTTYPVERLRQEFDAVCLTGGSRVPRDLPIEGRALRGIHFAMPYLVQSNRRVAGESVPSASLIDARGKQVVVIGGGDTGADCVGTANRQGAARVVQIELLPKPPERRQPTDLWPGHPVILRTSTSHEEGVNRDWFVLTKRFLGQGGAVKQLACVRVDWTPQEPPAPPRMTEVAGSDFTIDADLVLLAMGFVSPEPQALDALGARKDARGNAATNAEYATSIPGVFAAGDMRRGQSLVVWAISEGRRAAHYMDRYLMGASDLPLM